MAASLTMRLAAARRRARYVLVIERGWASLQPSLFLFALYVVACLARLPQSLPDLLHLPLELIILGTAVGLAVRGVRSLPLPTAEQLDRRIERDSHLRDQPLLTLTDRPALAGSEAQRLIWSRHIERIGRSLPALRVGLPRPALKRWERGLTALTILALTGSVLLHSASFFPRLAAGFVPGLDDDRAEPPKLQAWIERPDYAPGAPVFLSVQNHRPVTVPQGSVLHAMITRARGTPHWRGAERLSRSRLDATSWEEQLRLERSRTLTLRMRGRLVASWPVTIIPDRPPEVAWHGTPGPMKDTWRTRLPWSVKQHFGVSSLEAEITLPPPYKGRVLHVPIPLKDHPDDAHGIATPDLSSDPFAGEPVSARLHARSVSGRESFSASQSFRLGSRRFSDPLARALIALRKRLLLHAQARAQSYEELSLLAQTRQPPSVLAPMGLILSALKPGASAPSDSPPAAPALIAQRLWYLALYLDDLKRDGPEIADSAAEIRAAQSAVREQITRMAAPPTLAEQEELHRRLARLKDALTRRMTLLFRHAAHSGVVMPQPAASSADPWSDLTKNLSSDALQGHRDDALRRLEQMEDMAEHMRQATGQDLQALAQQMKARAEAAAQLATLRDMVRRETRLLDRTQARFNAARRAAAPPEEENGGDISQMSTAELLRQLGIRPPAGMEPSGASPRQAAIPPVDEPTVLLQAEERRHDHAVQRALGRLGDILARHVKELTGKPVKNLAKAHDDIAAALQALAKRQDHDAAIAEQKVLKDLAEAHKEMRRNQKASTSGKGGALSFIPSQKAGHGHDSAQGKGSAHASGEGDESEEDEAPSDRDPLGRKLGEGNDSKDSDAHIPDHALHDRARDIERELRRRASDLTRPPSELDYLNRLLKGF